MLEHKSLLSNQQNKKEITDRKHPCKVALVLQSFFLI